MKPCLRCKLPLPPEREPFGAHAECVTRIPSAGSGPLPRTPRVPYGRFPTTDRARQKTREMKR